MNGADATLRVRGDTSGAQRAFVGLNQVVTAGQPQVEKYATAVSGVASALGGAGSQAGAFAGAAANIGAAFAAGGALSVGLIAVTSGVAALANAWEEAKKKAEESAREQFDSIDALANKIADATAGIDDKIADALGGNGFELSIARLRVEIGDLERELQEAGSTGALAWAEAVGVTVNRQEAWRAHLAQLEQQLEDKQVALIGAQDALAEYNQRVGILEKLQKQLATATKGAAGATKKLKEESDPGPVDAYGQSWANVARVISNVESAQRASLRAFADAEAQFEANAFEVWLQNALELQAEQVQEAQRLRGLDLQDAFADHDAKLEAQRAAQQRSLELMRQHEEEKRRSQEAAALAEMQLRQQVANFAIQQSLNVATTGLQAIEMVVAGEHDAALRLIPAVMQQAGTAMIGFGASTFAAGLGKNAVVPGSGVDAMAVGAGLVAAGLGLGGAGAVTGGIMSRASGGGSAGGGQRDRSELFVGNSRLGVRSNAGPSYGDNQMTINIMGGTIVGDPTESARHVARLNRRASRQLLQG